MTEEEKAIKRVKNRQWREAHPEYFAERSKRYREAFIAKHKCTCLYCCKEFPGYRASYCSPECQKAARRKYSKSFVAAEKITANRKKFQQILDHVIKSGLKKHLLSIPRSADSDFLGLQSYIRRNNLLEYLQSIPRIAE